MESVNTPTGDDALKTAKRLIKETIPNRKKIIRTICIFYNIHLAIDLQKVKNLAL